MFNRNKAFASVPENIGKKNKKIQESFSNESTMSKDEKRKFRQALRDHNAENPKSKIKMNMAKKMGKKKRTASSSRWLNEHFKDQFVQKAHKQKAPIQLLS